MTRQAWLCGLSDAQLTLLLHGSLKDLSERRRPRYGVTALRQEIERRRIAGQDKRSLAVPGAKVIRDTTQGQTFMRRKHDKPAADDFKTAAQIEAEERQIGHIESRDDLSHLGAIRR